ncbi:ATP-binding protein [Aureimonas populi]|uniref:histidine kinase n=1 Tax=Aureimonas populi TaxID=1701758 RepID=A0ABW5CG00_9HYPH|nr:ATP-binding protein [Aureimonas populi]
MPMRFVPALLLSALGLLVLVSPTAGALAALAAAFLFAVLAFFRGASAPPVLRSRERAGRTGRAEEARAGLALEALREPLFLVDAALGHQFSNQAARSAFGRLLPGDPVVMRFRDPKVLAAAEEALASGEMREIDYVERGAEARFWSLSILPLRAEDQPVESLLLHFRDRSGEHRAERMRTDFVANASHELRTPLSSIVGFIETLEGPARDDAQARARFLSIMRDQAGRMSRLIDDLLSLSRIETRPRLTPQDRADLAEVLRIVARQMQPVAAEAGLVIELEGIESHAPVRGDMDELVRVFSNLVENACRYAPGGERIVVGLKVGAAGFEAYVRDFGPGIEARHIPRLTERFYRVEEGSALSFKGTGLGLSIVRNILVRHGTRLSIRSVPGEGSVFSVALRRAIDDGNEKTQHSQ